MNCRCHKCDRLDAARFSELDGSLGRRFMIVCPDCGNKRCPKASDHDLACTGSNAPGQKGSVYE